MNMVKFFRRAATRWTHHEAVTGPYGGSLNLDTEYNINVNVYVYEAILLWCHGCARARRIILSTKGVKMIIHVRVHRLRSSRISFIPSFSCHFFQGIKRQMTEKYALEIFHRISCDAQRAEEKSQIMICPYLVVTMRKFGGASVQDTTTTFRLLLLLWLCVCVSLLLRV